MTRKRDSHGRRHGYLLRSAARQAASRIRRLGVEQLESRALLAADVLSLHDAVPGDVISVEAPAYLGLPDPPAEYRSARVSDQLTRVAWEYDRWRAVTVIVRPFVPMDPVIQIREGRVLVEAVTTGSTAKMAEEFVALGAELIAVSEPGLAAWVPLSQIRQLDSVSELTRAKALFLHVVLHVGSTTIQGEAAIGADNVRGAVGVDGAGQKIGVVSDSYNRLVGAVADIASGDLPGTGNPVGNTTPVQVVAELPILPLARRAAADDLLARILAFNVGRNEFAADDTAARDQLLSDDSVDFVLSRFVAGSGPIVRELPGLSHRDLLFEFEEDSEERDWLASLLDSTLIGVDAV